MKSVTSHPNRGDTNRLHSRLHSRPHGHLRNRPTRVEADLAGRPVRAAAVALAAMLGAASAATVATVARADIPNDSCTTALSVGPGSIVVPNLDASPFSSDQSSCGILVRLAWYRYTATETVDVAFEASPVAPKGSIYLGALDSCGQFVTECLPGSSTYPAKIRRFSMQKGETIHLVVANDDLSPPTNALLTVSESATACGAGGQGLSCCIGGNLSGCNDADCCATVCTIDPFCCEQHWDFACTNRARAACDICLAPDCDGNGLDDSIEFGPYRTLLLAPNHWHFAGGDETAFCPQVNPSQQVGMVVKGPLLGGAPRQATLYTDWEMRSLDVSAANAVISSAFESSATVTALGEDGIRIAASGPFAPALLKVKDLVVQASRIEVGRATSDGTLLIENSDVATGVLSAGEGSVIVGTTAPTGEPLGGDLEISEAAFIGDNASLHVGPGGSVSLFGGKVATNLVVRGLVDLSPGATLFGDLLGTEPSSWLRTAGSIEGEVRWSGCIRPKDACSIVGSLVFEPYEGAPRSRYLWDASAGSSKLLTVSGTATLGGTLFIDARGASVGSSAAIIRAGGFEGAFDSVQVFGLPPQLALVVAPVSGGAMSELRAQVVTVAQLLGYGEGENYPLELEPKDTVTADFDADGVDDLAVSLSAGAGQPGAIAVFRGTGAGLQQVSQLSVGTDPRGLDAADFDLDGKTDLVVALAGDDAVRVLRNTTVAVIDFGQLAAVPVGDEPVDVAALDFFADAGASLAASGKDVLVAVAGDSTFVALKNTGGVVGNSGSTTTPSPGGIPTSVGGGDVDNDRVDDGVGGTSDGTTIIPGGVGSFAGGAVVFVPTPHAVTSITLADLNGDGGLDIAATLDANAPRPTPPGTPLVFDTLALVEHRPTGFNTTLFDYGYRGRSLARGDFDADGDEDLAFASRDDLAGAAQLRIVRNDMTAAGALLTRQDSPAITVEPLVVGTISIDGNGDDVLALGPGTSDANSNLFLQRFAEPALFGDLDGDGVVDATDLSALLLHWGEPGPTDLDGSGATDAIDLGLLLDRWTGK